MANILIVDDEAAIADLIQLTLAQAGHKSETAMSGSEAADKLEKEQYDLVLLDVMLPEISGFELMEYLAPTGTPVIFLTANLRRRGRWRTGCGGCGWGRTTTS